MSLNIMWLHLEQASFKMTREQYMDKLDSVAALVNVLGQTDKVGCSGLYVSLCDSHTHGVDTQR